MTYIEVHAFLECIQKELQHANALTRDAKYPIYKANS